MRSLVLLLLSFSCGGVETAIEDAGSNDSGSYDSGSKDVGSIDVGPNDTGTIDTGTIDTPLRAIGSASAASPRRSPLS